jgi:endonuclease YncB( thermonuclease family)
MARVFERYAPKDSPYYALQSEARLSKRGLWADQLAVTPWEWRASTRSNR